METLLKGIVITAVVVLIGYSIIGTDGKVDAIREKAPLEMEKQNLAIIVANDYRYM